MLQIIGAGLPRTGTLAQKIALELLGQGPCYHMVTVLGDLDQVELWDRALAGDGAWEEIFDGYRSTVDWPGSFFYRELIDVYPEAKVVLSVRDPQRWAASMRKTVLRAHRGDNVMQHLSRARALVEPAWEAYNRMTAAMLDAQCGLLGADAQDESALADVLRRHIADVKATVPASRLLVWAAADGWAPLCEFIGVPTPSQPFPHVNDSTMFEDRLVEGSLAALNRYWDKAHPAG